LLLQEGATQCFIEYSEPKISLVIVGAGNDAIPLAKIAAIIGWDITIVDGRMTHATQQRFSAVNQIHVGKPLDVFNSILIDEQTALVLMTHNYNYDLSFLELLQGKSFGYLGLLGPASKRDRMLQELEQKSVVFLRRRGRKYLVQPD